MVMGLEGVEFSVKQAAEESKKRNQNPNVESVAPCVLEEAGTMQCMYRVAKIRGGTVTCPVKLGKSDPPNDGCEELISEHAKN